MSPASRYHVPCLIVLSILGTVLLLSDSAVMVSLILFFVISTVPDMTSTVPSDDIPKIVPRTAAVVSQACILRLDHSDICVALVHMVPLLRISCICVMRLFFSGAMSVPMRISVCVQDSQSMDCEPSLKYIRSMSPAATEIRSQAKTY